MAEKVNEDIILVYSSPAFPPKGIDVNNIYYFGKDGKGTYLVSNGEKKYEKIEYIKTFFTPDKKSWEDVLCK
jgi:hypothetical protein